LLIDAGGMFFQFGLAQLQLPRYGIEGVDLGQFDHGRPQFLRNPPAAFTVLSQCGKAGADFGKACLQIGTGLLHCVILHELRMLIVVLRRDCVMARLPKGHDFSFP
jgi:hypothetical protein